jgi:hypothetical protein
MSKNVKEKEKFLWYVNSSVSTLAKLAEVSLYEFNTDY